MFKLYQFIIVLLIFIERIHAQDCQPVKNCIEGYGAVFSLPFLPDFNMYNELTYKAFLLAMCSNLVPYSKCQMYNESVFTTCAFIGDFDGGLTATQDQKSSLAETQCTHVNGMVDTTTCLQGNATLTAAVSSCDTEISTALSAQTTPVCTIVNNWKLCVQENVAGACTTNSDNYGSVLSQKYIDTFCANSKANETISNALTLSLVLLFLLCIIHETHISLFL